LTERRQQFARLVAALVGIATLQVFCGARTAWAQGAVRDQSGTLTTTADDQAKKTWLEQRFGGSIAELTTYVGTGTFYTSGYRDPYISNALFFRPQYNLGTKYKLALRARVYLEEEYTTPDTSNGRRFYPLDTIFYLNARNLYTGARSKVTFFGGGRVVVPTSYESRYAHLVTTLGLSAGATRTFEFGRPDAQGKRWGLNLLYAQIADKALRTSAVRGSFPGDTNGCRTTGPAGETGSAGGAESDRCGGPLNTSYSFAETGIASLTRGRVSLTVSLIVINEFKYSIDADRYTMLVAQSNQRPTGRADFTWGVTSLAYEITDKVSVSLGVASYQPAMDSRQQNLRFPFFDFNGTNADNFTQVSVGVSGTL